MTQPVDLYALLPVVHRLRDAEQGEPLRALLSLISTQATALRDDLDGLFDDLFVETAAEWVIPYIGDLVANTPLHPVGGVSARSDVAETIGWRRRKGTLATLGRLARSVTGWDVHAVAAFELLAWNQHLEHLRLEPAAERQPHRDPFAHDRVGTIDLRSRGVVDRVRRPFDIVAHNVDVRHIADADGWYGIRKVCFFVYRLKAYPLDGLTPVPADEAPSPGCLRVHPLGIDAPLFHTPDAMTRETQFATELNCSAPIRPYGFFEDPAREYGAGRSLEVTIDGKGVPLHAVLCKDLTDWPAVPDDRLAIDVRTGRIQLGADLLVAGPPNVVRVTATHGFPAPIGGGPYRRSEVGSSPPTVVTVGERGADATTIEAAIAGWQGAADRQALYVRIVDSATYRPAGGSLVVAAGPGTPVDISIVADEGQRPTIVADLRVSGTAAAPIDAVLVDGVVLSGQLELRGAVRNLTVRDATLVPGVGRNTDGTPTSPDRASFVADAAGQRRDIRFERAITGPLRVAAGGNHLRLVDSAVDAPVESSPARVAIAADDAGAIATGVLRLERCTVLGSVRARELELVSESIVTAGPLVAERRQRGCVRFSWYEPDGSRTPRRYRCQPDMVHAAEPGRAEALTLRTRPAFTTTRFGRAAYLQLASRCDEAIVTGAEDGGEIGVFHLLGQPHRETNLRVRVEEYLPFGLEPGIVHVT